MVTPYVKWRPTGHMYQLIKYPQTRLTGYTAIQCSWKLPCFRSMLNPDCSLPGHSHIDSGVWEGPEVALIRQTFMRHGDRDKAERAINVYSKEIKADFLKYEIVAVIYRVVWCLGKLLLGQWESEGIMLVPATSYPCLSTVIHHSQGKREEKRMRIQGSQCWL